MNITITKKQNVKIDGVKYKAKRQLDCNGCAFDHRDEKFCRPMPCRAQMRADEHSVIFVKTNPWIAVNGVKPDIPLGRQFQWKDRQGNKAITSGPLLNWSFGEPDEVTHYRLL